ncbi:MAG: hypothetical protein HWD61_13215 [Parachlamydiaceae bacterium]|nr:MAG: hypothetical protein HWD61_13215 [Parachlamydiaceae bacterium]
MSSSLSNQTQTSVWSNYIVPYASPPIAAGAGIVPVFYGFVAKSAMQLGQPLPKMTVKEVLQEGGKAAPTIGIIVGTQMIVQSVAENAFMKNTKNEQPSFKLMIASSLLVGGFSAPALAVFNAQTMGRSVADSLKSLTTKQVVAIVTRETSFLFSLRISDPASDAMKSYCGDNKAIEYSSAFATGFIGSIIGHPADTALTLWQKGRKIEKLSQLKQGVLIKAFAVGGFSVIYKVTKEWLQSQSF